MDKDTMHSYKVKVDYVTNMLSDIIADIKEGNAGRAIEYLENNGHELIDALMTVSRKLGKEQEYEQQ